ncbi:amino acid adenylation domain-containing protein [Streptomyces ovatisporus]|uniref:Amino acid adenylation domain-containing protein n=1 Tax=Streptomyces ovatisporus TaxID=1128682 RepID=A0ABV9A1G0_9ACTN
MAHETTGETAEMTAAEKSSGPAGGASVWALFQRQAALSPGRTALVVGGTELTYRELDAASAALARRLRSRGASAGRVVCIRLEQNAVAVAAMLAALRIGAAWAVVEPDQPPSRLRALLADTDCAVVVTSGPDAALEGLTDIPERLDVAGLDVRELLEPGGTADEADGADTADTAAAADLAGNSGPAATGQAEPPEQTPAYIVCTSGSTGTPKGVMVSRGSLAASIEPRPEVYGEEHATCVMAMRLSFDGMLGGMFWSFSNGHTLVLPDDKQLKQVHELGRLAGEHDATHLIVVPSYYRALLKESRLLPETLRLVVVAGEACTPDLVRAHTERLPRAVLVNEYGPTETTISCTVAPGLDPAWSRIPIGRPWRGAEARVLDDRLREVGPGVHGELYIGGPFVALGYAGQPGKTAERFVADPFGPPGARMYRTGDIAHVDGSGSLHYHGRSDQQVKIRGARIELGEVEAALEHHPAVGQAVVVCDTGAGEPRLAAFLTPVVPGGGMPAWSDLRAHCWEFLVEQAVPVLFRTLERMPLNSSGKADRAALLQLLRSDAGEADRSGTANAGSPAGEGASGGDAGGSGQAADPVRGVAEIWAAVLGHDEAGPDDNFFAVGGSSLRVIDLHKQLDARWPGVLRVGELFDLTTVGAQAEAITDRLGPRPDGEDDGPAEDIPAAYEL